MNYPKDLVDLFSTAPPIIAKILVALEPIWLLWGVRKMLSNLIQEWLLIEVN